MESPVSSPHLGASAGTTAPWIHDGVTWARGGGFAV